MSPAKMLNHHLEYSVISKYRLLLQPPVCPALYCLAGLYFTASFRRSHTNLPQETGKFKNKIPPRLFNAKTPSVAPKIHQLGMHSCGSLLDEHHCLWLPVTLAVWVLSRYLLVARDRTRGWRDLWWDLLLCSHVGLCFHLHVCFEDTPVVLFP